MVSYMFYASDKYSLFIFLGKILSFDVYYFRPIVIFFIFLQYFMILMEISLSVWLMFSLIIDIFLFVRLWFYGDGVYDITFLDSNKK